MDNHHFKSQTGEKYLTTVRETLFELDANTADFWDNELRKQNGAIQFERYIAKLRAVSGQYHQMNGKLSIIGTQIDYCIGQLYELKGAIFGRKNTHAIKENLTRNAVFITTVLTDVKNELGDNKKRWYKEFSTSDSKIANEIWGKFKNFNNQGGK